MNKSSTVVLQAIVVLIGLAGLTFLLGEPHLEGRNAQATLFEIYFTDMFLAYAYIGSIPFFIGIYQAFTALGYAGRHTAFSQPVVNAVRKIKYCAIATIGFVIGGEVFFILGNTSDDRAGGVFMGILFSFASFVVAATATMLERKLRKNMNTGHLVQ
jgi:hypothetical protein